MLAALPMAAGSAASAGAGLGAKGTAAAKSGFLAAWLATLAPFIGIFAGIGHFALCSGIVLVILNLRLNAWMASRRECSLAEIHGLLPAWVIPMLTLALVLWVGLVLALTKPTRRS